jgi:hypothetical protein
MVIPKPTILNQCAADDKKTAVNLEVQLWAVFGRCGRHVWQILLKIDSACFAIHDRERLARSAAAPCYQTEVPRKVRAPFRLVSQLSAIHPRLRVTLKIDFGGSTLEEVRCGVIAKRRAGLFCRKRAQTENCQNHQTRKRFHADTFDSSIPSIKSIPSMKARFTHTLSYSGSGKTNRDYAFLAAESDTLRSVRPATAPATPSTTSVFATDRSAPPERTSGTIIKAQPTRAPAAAK